MTIKMNAIFLIRIPSVEAVGLGLNPCICVINYANRFYGIRHEELLEILVQLESSTM